MRWDSLIKEEFMSLWWVAATCYNVITAGAEVVAGDITVAA